MGRGLLVARKTRSERRVRDIRDDRAYSRRSLGLGMAYTRRDRALSSQDNNGHARSNKVRSIVTTKYKVRPGPAEPLIYLDPMSRCGSQKPTEEGIGLWVREKLLESVRGREAW